MTIRPRETRRKKEFAQTAPFFGGIWAKVPSLCHSPHRTGESDWRKFANTNSQFSSWLQGKRAAGSLWFLGCPKKRGFSGPRLVNL